MAAWLTPASASQSTQIEQLAGHGAEGPHMLADHAVLVDPAQASDDGLLVDVEPGATAVQGLHGASSGATSAGGRRDKEQSALRAPRADGSTGLSSRRCPGQTI
jgi:hypothetical protein